MLKADQGTTDHRTTPVDGGHTEKLKFGKLKGETRRQRAEDGGRRTEDGGQRGEMGRGQRAKDGGNPAKCRIATLAGWG